MKFKGNNTSKDSKTVANMGNYLVINIAALAKSQVSVKLFLLSNYLADRRVE